MWYVIQTVTGKEEELLTFMRTIIRRDLYTECFVIKAEWMKHLGGTWQIQKRTIFPGYVFIDTEQPEILFQELKDIPKFSKILETGQFEFTPVNDKEKELLQLLIQKSHLFERVICLSEIELDDQGKIASICGALRYFKNQIIKFDFHKRFAVISVSALGGERTLLLGIKLNKDKI